MVDLNATAGEFESNIKTYENDSVDDSNLDCGLNGALYFVQMDADGGKEKYGNTGAHVGLGYCDAQCPHDLKFINGEANVIRRRPLMT